MPTPEQQTRLYCLIARKAPIAVVFRRGPSKRVLLLKWNLENDTFEAGQWFKGRIYERRSDLSPDGQHLLYFAASHKLPYRTWTAISRPPYLTALALWSGLGTLEGGGLFDTDTSVSTYTFGGLAEGFHLDRNVRVRERHGESELARLARDGWVVKQEPPSVEHRFKNELAWDFGTKPAILAKSRSVRGSTLILEARIRGYHRRNGPWVVADHAVVDQAGASVLSLPDTDWSDWDHNGDLLYAHRGKLFRARFSRKYDKAIGPKQIELVDLSNQTFTAVPPPAWATHWNYRPRSHGRLVSRDCASD